MALQSSGAIAMSNFNTEMGIAATNPISLNDANPRKLANVLSGSISMSQFYSRAWEFSFVLSGGQNWVLSERAAAYGYDNRPIVRIYLQGTITASYTGTYAIQSGWWPAGTTVVIYCQGDVIGYNGGGGGATAGGGAGGHAVGFNSAISGGSLQWIFAGGRVLPGGGGGGGGGNGVYYRSSGDSDQYTTYRGGNGGYGAGTIGGAIGGSYGTYGTASGNYTTSSGLGGSGGDYGSPGGYGSQGAGNQQMVAPGPGGAGGYAFINSGFCWIQGASYGGNYLGAIG